MKNSTVHTATFEFHKTDVIPISIWLVVVFMTWLFMHGAEHFLKMTPEALGKYFELRWILIAHITAGGGALIIGIIQFWPKLRNSNRKIHRFIGFIYLLAILVSSLCALTLALTTAYKVNWANAFTLQVWACVWISATFFAYYALLKKRYKLHKEWMTRSYIITVAFLISGFTLKIPYVQQLGSYEEISTPLFWMSWSVPLYIYEIIRGSEIKPRQ